MRRLLPALGLAACVLIPSALFLGRYVVDGAGVAPAGSDTAQHVWRSAVVEGLGLDALPAFEGESQALNTNADRPGLPLAISVLSAITGADAFDLAYVLPAVVAAVVATAAAALAGAIPGVPGWGIVVAGLATGASVQVALAANGYLDQLLVAPLVLAAGAGALHAAAAGRGRAIGVVALMAAWLAHWQFALLFTGLLVVLALAVLPGSIRDRRGGRAFGRTPAGRVGAVAAGGAALGVAALVLGTPGTLRPPTGLSRGSIDRHLSDQLARYRLQGAAPVAAMGAASLVAGRDPARLRAAWLLGAWALLPVGMALLYAAGRTVPLQRSLSFALAIPLLGALGLVAATSFLRSRSGRWGTVVGAAAAVLTVAGLVASVAFAWETWRTREPWSEDPRLAEYRALGSYLAGAGHPAIVVVDGRAGAESGAERHFGTVPVMRRLRAELPPRLALRTTVYLGDPDRLLAGEPTLRPEIDGFDEISRETWKAVRPLLAGDPTIVMLRSEFVGFGEAVRDHPGWRAHRWVAVVSGPETPRSFERPALPSMPAPATLAGRWAACLALLTLAGLGWAVRLAGGSLMLRVAAAPATGLAIMIPVSLLAEHLGVRVGGLGGVLIWIAVAAIGAIVAIGRLPVPDPPGPAPALPSR